MIVLYFIITQSKKPLKFTASQLVNGILLSKLLWPTVRKKCSSVREKLLKLEAEGTNIYNYRTIYSNSERSEQCLITECFFNLFPEVSHVL